MKFESEDSLNRKMLEGINILADNVAATYGPRGNNVLLQEKDSDPFVTKDGVTVARFVHLDDPFMNAAVQVLKQAAIQTNNEAGDDSSGQNTTCESVICTEPLVKQGYNVINNEHEDIINIDLMLISDGILLKK